MLISKEYQEQNKFLHENHSDYGIIGQRYANLVNDVVRQYGVKDILDYGCAMCDEKTGWDGDKD